MSKFNDDIDEDPRYEGLKIGGGEAQPLAWCEPEDVLFNILVLMIIIFLVLLILGMPWSHPLMRR